CLESRLVIEVDGNQHAERAQHDATRTAWLTSEGYRVLRFTDREVLTALESVESAIWTALEPQNTPTPTLPPKGGGGGCRAAYCATPQISR
ncbi:MAG TPA: DUF559 domain-containing protein, partial [Dongiaceae bacterium]